MAKATTCIIGGCDKGGRLKRGWCSMHYTRWLKTGDPLLKFGKSCLTIEARFLQHADLNGPIPSWAPFLGPCWIWSGDISRDGYGKFYFRTGGEQHRWSAHRWAFVHFVGPIPTDTPHLDHLCRVRACCNPTHVEPVTPAENNQRGALLRTHCANGHRFTVDTIYWQSPTARSCRICRNEAARRYAEKVNA